MHQHTKNTLNNEQGLILVTLAISAISIFILVGLAVDSANLYIAKLNVQSAADAASLSGLGQIVTQRTDAEAVQAARFAARGNLLANKISEARFRWLPNNDLQNGGINAQWTGGVMNVRIDLDVPLYLLGGLPGLGIGPTKRISALGRAAIRNSNIALVLDSSNSMSCPTVSGDANFACPCLGQTPDCDQSPGSGAKIVALRNAVKEFVQNFKPEDGINVTAFGHGAEIITPFKPVGQVHNSSDIQSAIDNLAAEGATNLVDGIFTAYMDARAKSRTNDLFFVVFSDGAPTAARFHFDRSALQGNNSFKNRRNDVVNNVVGSGNSWANYDWMSWGVLARDAAGDIHPIPNRMYHTPPNDNTSYSHYWNRRTVSTVDPPSPPAVVVAAGTSRRSYQDITDPSAAFRGGTDSGNSLLKSMTVRMPSGALVRLGRPQLWNDACPNGFCWNNWIDESDSFWIYTDIALHLADNIRQTDKAIFFGIGYGGAAGNLPNNGNAGINCVGTDGQGVRIECADPYQGPTSANWRKDITYRRLTLSLCGYNDPAFYGVDLPPIQAMMRQNVKQHGEYYDVDSPQNLKAAFDKIARRIKMRRASNM